MIKKSIFIGLFSTVSIFAFSQDSTRFQDFEEVEIERTKLFKRVGLYDSYEEDNTPSILGFTQLNIFKNQMSDEVWTSGGKTCVDVQLKQNGEEKFLDLNWNKDKEGCDWVGIGFGWDFWSSKDMGQITNVSAIEIEVRSKGKTMGNLPWAMGFEDYAGGQAWTGFSKNFVPNGEITTEWTKVLVPMALFPFEEYDCDPSNIKQLIIQLFAEDAVEINSITIVPFEGKLRQETISQNSVKAPVKVDGDLTDWLTPFTALGAHDFAVKHTKDSIYVAIKVEDETPRLNNKTDGDLWNGDAIEIAFATNPNANEKRKLFLLSDYHIGLNCGPNPYLWNFSEGVEFEQGSFAIKNTDNGYTAEIAIALKDLTKKDITTIKKIGFEIALDMGDETQSRTDQVRWNSSTAAGFHTNPSLWGSLLIK